MLRLAVTLHVPVAGSYSSAEFKEVGETAKPPWDGTQLSISRLRLRPVHQAATWPCEKYGMH